MEQLLARLEGARLEGDPGAQVVGISHDSRAVSAGQLFAAMPGERFHGLNFLDQAVNRGACGVLSDRLPPSGFELPWIVSPRPRAHMAMAAFTLAGDPQESLLLAGVTGTNGKSTTAHLLSLMLEAQGTGTAFIGTLGCRMPGGEQRPAERTTPEATELAPVLAETVAVGGGAAVMEVSSHALLLDRLAGLNFQVAVWTNLSHDHLDYHHTMHEYFNAKRRLFDHHLAEDGRRVLPVDDPWASRLLEQRLPGDLSWGLESGDVSAARLHFGLDGTTFDLRLPGVELRAHLPLLGRFNLANALAAAAAAHAVGVSPEAIRRALGAAEALTGRLERVQTSLPFPVFVDYAHTPEGLRAVLEALAEIGDHRLIVVFGAGGDRDTAKRAPMGEAVGELADVAVVTSDNPRTEDPATIAAAVAHGVSSAGAEPVVILDRRQAINRALELADPGSLVLVAGKGHESTQTIGEQKIPFFDQQVILDLAGRASCA